MSDLDFERLAEAEHNQWMRWVKTLVAKAPGLSPARVARWSRLFVPYANLSEDKEKDREQARTALVFATAASPPKAPSCPVCGHHRSTVLACFDPNCPGAA